MFYWPHGGNDVSLAERPRLRLFTLSALFFAQGIPWGFLAFTLPAYLTQHGADAALLGSVVAMSYWPYVFKWVWGPAIDAVTIRHLGRRRPWIVFAQAMMAVTAGALVLVQDPSGSTTLLLTLILAHTVFNSIQNVAVDALAIDLLDPSERGRANGFMYGAKWAGGIVGGAGMGNVIERLGFDAAIAIQVALLGVILILPVLVHERTGAPTARPEPRDIARALSRVYALRSPWFAALAMLVANIAGGALTVVAPDLFMNHLRWQLDEYSAITGGFGLLVGAIGSAVGGVLADLVGHRRLAAIASLVMAAGWIVFAVGEPWWHERTFIYALAVLEPFTNSIMIVSLWSVCMSVSLKQTAATQFAAYTSLTSLSIVVGSRVVAPSLSERWEFWAIYLAAGLFQAATIAILYFIDPGEVRRELQDV
jgi:PAT family beta-lactamase induction signal transducer AmpG